MPKEKISDGLSMGPLSMCFWASSISPSWTLSIVVPFLSIKILFVLMSRQHQLHPLHDGVDHACYTIMHKVLIMQRSKPLQSIFETTFCGQPVETYRHTLTDTDLALYPVANVNMDRSPPCCRCHKGSRNQRCLSEHIPCSRSCKQQA